MAAGHKAGGWRIRAGSWILALCAGLPMAATGSGTPAPEWRNMSGLHFVVRYQGTRESAERALQSAEADYHRISGDLGFVRQEDFWLWDKRVTICLYPDAAAFHQATQAPAWAAGKADHVRREISGSDAEAPFLSVFLPHELTHLIFRDYIGFQSDAPLWLDEGVAQWETQADRGPAQARAKALAAAGRLTPLAELTRMDVRRETNVVVVQDFYAQAAALIGYLIESGGLERFASFCRRLRDGKDMADALRFTYPESLRSMAALEAGWRTYLGGGKP